MNSKSKQSIIPHQFSDKCVALLYFIALVPCSLKLLMGINARIGISAINPFLKALLLFIPAILGFRSLYKELKWWDFLVVTGIIWFVYWSPNLYPQTTIAVLEFAPYFLIYCLPYYLVGASINISQQRGLFYHIGYYGLIINIIIGALAVGGIAKKMFGEENNMELAYGILPSLILVVMNALNNKSRKDFALSVIGTLLIFALGSRGALLSLLFFISGDLILFKKYLNPVAARIRIIISAVVIGLLLEPLLSFMETFTSALGFGTRVYDSILGGNLISTYNRDWIYDLVADYIKTDSGHIGYGLFYDRVLMGMDTSSYAHNLFYEITLNFGIYIGLFILFVLGAIFVRNIIKTKGTPTCAMIFAFFCFCVIGLFFSSSYLRSSLFWLFIGLMISTIRKPTSLLMSQNS